MPHWFGAGNWVYFNQNTYHRQYFILVNCFNFDLMKKTVVILLMLIYGFATMGATVHLHYCMNEFVGWSLLGSKGNKCGKCGMGEKDKEGCCKDEHKQFKLKTDHQHAGVTAFLIIVLAPAITTPVPYFNFQPFLQIAEGSSTCHAPPTPGDIKLHALYCVFLI